LQPLTRQKLDGITISETQSQIILKIAENFILSGYFLQSLKENRTISTLQQIKGIHKNFVMRFLLIKKDLTNLTELFRIKDIENIILKGMALKLMDNDFFQNRQIRDIDILIPKNKIEHAYRIMRNAGFSYMYDDIEDSAVFKTLHHIPPMINKNGTIVELHHRITNIWHYKNCPLTDLFFLQKKKIKVGSKDIYIPSIKNMMIHAFYHGYYSDRNLKGPSYFYDINLLFQKNQKAWPQRIRDVNLIDKNNKFPKFKSLIEDCNYDVLIKDKDIKYNLDKTVNLTGFNKKFHLLRSERNYLSFKEMLLRLNHRHKYISYRYQVAPFTLKYFIYFALYFWEIIKRLKI